MTPSSPAPSNRWNQSSASARSSVAGVRWTGGAAAARAVSRRARRSPWGTRAQVLVAEGEEVPGHERGGRLGRQHPDPRLGRVDPEQEGVEVEMAGRTGDDHLAVDHAPFGQGRPERRGELREVAVERLQVARLDQGLVAVPEDDRPEAVPLRLEQPAVAQRAGSPDGLASIGSSGGSKGRCMGGPYPRSTLGRIPATTQPGPRTRPRTSTRPLREGPERPCRGAAGPAR